MHVCEYGCLEFVLCTVGSLLTAVSWQLGVPDTACTVGNSSAAKSSDQNPENILM